MASSSSSQQSTQSSSSTTASSREEFVVRVPVLAEKKKYSVFKFSSNLGIDVTQWNNINLSREDNAQVFVDHRADDPKFGAGSEYGKQQRMEARRKKLGFRRRMYKIDDQPWTIQIPGKPQERKFRGQKEGGVTANADYWIFVKSGEGAFDAFPVSDWYNFMPISRFKTLDIDEAEERFQMRDKVLNQFALQSLLKLGRGGGGDGETSGGGGKDEKKKKLDDDEAEDVGPVKGTKKGAATAAKKKPPKKPKKKFNDDDDDPMASPDSDDGDGEGRELDYISSSSDSDPDDEPPEELQMRNDRGVDEEIGMRQMIADEDDEEGEGEGAKDGEEQKPDFNKVESMPTSGFGDEDEKESDSGSDSDDPDKEDIKVLLIPQKKTDGAGTSGASAGTSGEASTKRKAPTDEKEQPAAKKHKGDKEAKQKSDKPATMEEEVARYLQRRPLSTTDLVSKFKKRLEKGVSKQEIVQQLADVLKKLKPEQERRNGILYFSLKKT